MKTRTFLSSAALSIAVLTAVSLASPRSLASVVVYYGGDANGFDHIASYADPISNPSPPPVHLPISMVYDDFKVNVPTTITGLWGNFSEASGNSFTSYNFGGPLPAYFEIRSGVARGDGGTLVTAGELTLLAEDTGRSFGGNPEMKLSGVLNQLNQVLLDPGVVYWLGIAPISSEALYVSTTSGNDAGSDLPSGDPNPEPLGLRAGNAFLSDSQNLFQLIKIEDKNKAIVEADFSYGIIGTPIPEPSTFIAGALLAVPFGIQGLRYLRNRKRAV